MDSWTALSRPVPFPNRSEAINSSSVWVPPVQHSVPMGLPKPFKTFSTDGGVGCYNPLKWHSLSGVGAIVPTATANLLITYGGSLPKLLWALLVGGAITAGSR